MFKKKDREAWNLGSIGSHDVCCGTSSRLFEIFVVVVVVQIFFLSFLIIFPFVLIFLLFYISVQEREYFFL